MNDIVASEHVRSDYRTMANLYTHMESRYVKILADIVESIDIVTKYVHVLASIKADNITLPSVPQDLLDMITAQNSTLTQINADISNVVESGTSTYSFVSGLVGIGFTLFRYTAQYSYIYIQNMNLPSVNDFNMVVRMQSQSGVTSFYGVMDYYGEARVFEIDQSSGLVRRQTSIRDIGIVNSKWDKIMSAYEYVQRKAGVAITIAITLGSLAMCAWHITEINKKTDEAMQQLTDLSISIDALKIDVQNSTEILQGYLNETIDAVDGYISNFDILVDILLESNAFETATNITVKDAIENIGNTTTNYNNSVERMEVVEGFLEDYRSNMKLIYQTTQVEVSVAEGVKIYQTSLDMVRAIENQGVFWIDQFGVLQKIAALSNGGYSTWDSVNLDCIRNGNIQSQGDLDSYLATLEANGLNLNQEVMRDIAVLADSSVFLRNIRSSIKSAYGIELSNGQVLSVIANLDGWKAEDTYPRPNPYDSYYGTTTVYHDLVPYRSTSSSC